MGISDVHNCICVEYVSNKEAKKLLHPKYSWSIFKPNMSYLKVFGSIMYRRVLDQLRKNLDDKGEKMMLVGYHSTDGD